ncbi:MAG: TolC family protein [Candidatus Obscuribacterales bacterium]|nr:TolC family protein [Candidatus Obscuribacterales bacterium]
MRERVWSSPGHLSLRHLLIATICSTSITPALAVSEVRDQTVTVDQATALLKTKMPNMSDKKPPQYFVEVNRSQELRPIGLEPVKPVEHIAGTENNSAGIPVTNDEAFVPLTRPPLQALISVQANLNPFSMDATHSERVNLKDALIYATAQNLAIENSFDSFKSQRFKYLSATSKFLPDIKTGYSLVGLTGSLPGTLLGGTTASAGGTPTSIQLPSHAQVLNAGFVYHAYQGGKVLFGSLEEKHRLRASRAALKGSVNDVLLDGTKRYYNLVLNEALLEIRNRAVEISLEQVRMNSSQEHAGTATGLDVLQSQAQLASDQQNLVDQQSTRRQSAIQLSAVLNASFAQDLVSQEETLRKKRVIPQIVPIDKLLLIAIDNRPELKQYEELRLAAKRAIIVASAPLQPNINLAGTYYGIGASHSGTQAIGVLNFSIAWTLGALGTTDLANIQQARWQARQAAVQAKQTFQDVFEQVRIAYDQSLAADKRIESASAQIIAADEELRIAKKRMSAGLGLNLDVLNAQRDRTQASINKAQAIVDFNIAQAQLLHDVGLISVETVTSGAKI